MAAPPLVATPSGSSPGIYLQAGKEDVKLQRMSLLSGQLLHFRVHLMPVSVRVHAAWCSRRPRPSLACGAEGQESRGPTLGLLPRQQVLLAGMLDTSAVTMLFTPRLNRAPRTRPQVKARYCTVNQSINQSLKQKHTGRHWFHLHSCPPQSKRAGACCGGRGVPLGPDPDTVSPLTVDSGAGTCCPGGRRCPERSQVTGQGRTASCRRARPHCSYASWQRRPFISRGLLLLPGGLS